MADTPFHLFGIRHHGPGCARSLVAALERLAPDCLLVEGPPEGESMLALLDHPDLQPPVALLVYNPETAHEAAFYPFARFSPEWNALHYARAHALPVRFMDLPVAHRFALDRPAQEEAATASADGESDAVTEAAQRSDADDVANAVPAADGLADGDDDCGGPDGTDADATDDEAGLLPTDPLDWLACAAGYGDGETWWNHMVEERGDSLELFAAIAEAMTALRGDIERPLSAGAAEREQLREAHMRKCMRQAQKEGYQRIAVVCGAWHVPALATLGPAKADNERLKGLPKCKVESTWVPWSYRHLSYASGYGAGIAAPGWYDHLWRCQPSQRATAWLARAAALFREADLDCSSAHIIEAVRLADTLAALRERPQPGLEELTEALRTVVCLGDAAPLRLIEGPLMVGDRLGSIPEDAPAMPLQRDLAQWQKRLRLKPEAGHRDLDLDLRQPNDLARSHLLHRLKLLDVPWGHPGHAGNSKGSFHELWRLQWAPELALAVIAAGRWGNSVEDAAAACAIAAAAEATLAELSELVNQVLLADLQTAIGAVTQALEDRAAVANDVLQLLAAVPALANIARYGNVRGTDAGMVMHVLTSLVPRAAIGLPDACTSLDDDAATRMREAILATQQALRVMNDAELLQGWRQALTRLAESERSHALIAGLAARLLFDDEQASREDSARRMHRALSQGNAPGAAAAWLEGFLNRSGMVLLHDDALWSLVDNWLCGLGDEHFINELPLLRRAFGDFSVPERRQLGERAARGGAQAPVAAMDWNVEWAVRAVPLLQRIFGVAS